ncbi:CHASE3 domain-containing protein, partial [Staphylococcus aureus]
TQDNPNQRANLARLRQMLAVLFAARTQSIAMVDSGRMTEAMILFYQEASVRRMTAIRDTFDHMAAEERR